MSESTTLALMERDKRIAELERKIAELQAAYEEQAEFIRRYQAERPAVDAAPEVHGRWIKNKNEAINPFGGIEPILIDTFQCSVCGVHFDIGEPRHYCPNCGARMDAEGGAGE